MISHALIIAFMENLASLGLALYLFRWYRHGVTSALLGYLALMSLFSFYGYFQKDIIRLIWGRDTGMPLSPDRLHFWLTYLTIPFLVTGDFLFIQVFRRWVGVALKQRFTLMFFTAQALIFVGMGMFSMIRAELEAASLVSMKGAFEVVYLVLDGLCIAFALSHARLYRDRLKDPLKRRGLTVLTWLYLGLLLPNYLLYLIYQDRGMLYALQIVLVHLVDLPPLVFLFFYFKKHGMEYLGEEEGLNRLRERFGITPREEEIVRLICRGKSNREIAETLFISLQTVKDHVHNVFRKTGVKSRIQLANRVRDEDAV